MPLPTASAATRIESRTTSRSGSPTPAPSAHGEASAGQDRPGGFAVQVSEEAARSVGARRLPGHGALVQDRRVRRRVEGEGSV